VVGIPWILLEGLKRNTIIEQQSEWAVAQEDLRQETILGKSSLKDANNQSNIDTYTNYSPNIRPHAI